MKGILFSPEMAAAVYRGDKTQTRRVSKLYFDNFLKNLTPPCFIGDTMYVREAWRTLREYNHLKPSELPEGAHIYYEADGNMDEVSLELGRYRHARFMPMKFARQLIEVESISSESLHDISEGDACAEGVGLVFIDDLPMYRNYLHENTCLATAIKSFKSLWISINGQESWDSNPVVWVIKFKKVIQ